MTYYDLIKYYGSEVKAAAGIGMSVTAVRSWIDKPIPRITQYAIQAMTNDQLSVDEGLQ